MAKHKIEANGTVESGGAATSDLQVSSGTMVSGLVGGGFIGAVVGGLPGAVAGMTLGALAGELLHRRAIAESKDD